MDKVIIFGADINAKLALHYFKTDSNYEPVAFTVDKKYLKGDSYQELPLIDFDNIALKLPPDRHKLFVAIGYTSMNKIREQKCKEAKKKGYELVSYVSSKCNYLSEYNCGENCFILEDNTIQPFVKIGNNVTLWSGNHIGHDVTIEDNCFITSHVVISGFTHVGKNSFVGVNATLRDSIKIGEQSLIGAGAIIMADTEPKSVHLPAKSVILKKNSDQISL